MFGRSVAHKSVNPSNPQFWLVPPKNRGTQWNSKVPNDVNRYDTRYTRFLWALENIPLKTLNETLRNVWLQVATLRCAVKSLQIVTQCSIWYQEKGIGAVHLV